MIEPDLNPHLKVKDWKKLAAESEPDLQESSVNISCFDYGAFGWLKVTAVLDDGTEIPAHIEGDKEMTALTVPRDDDGNKVADYWDRQTGYSGKAANTDDDSTPEGDGQPGDGLTYFEEYRGFFENGSHIRTYPEEKDLFVCNEIGDHGKRGVRLFQAATGLKIHGGLTLDELSEDRVVNRYFSKDTHVVHQHGLRIQWGTESGVSMSIPTRNFPYPDEGGTPEKWDRVVINPERRYGSSGYSGESTARAVAHELGHCCNLDHHGEGDLGEMIIGPALHPTDPSKRVVKIWNLDDKGRAIRDRIISLIWEPTMEAIVPRIPRRVYLGVAGGERSGDADCIMRYFCANIYEAEPGLFVQFPDEEAHTHAGLCRSAGGTGVNDAGRKPFPRYRDASPGCGNCAHHLLVNDRYYP